jgi:hypothetical protein
MGLFGRMISQSQGRYLHTEQHKHRINAHTQTSMPRVIRTHKPSARAGEDRSCLRPRGHCDRLASERAKTVHALDRAATVIGDFAGYLTYTHTHTHTHKFPWYVAGKFTISYSSCCVFTLRTVFLFISFANSMQLKGFICPS